LGVSRFSILNYEQGKSKPNAEFFELLAEKYNVNINFIITGKGDIFESNNPLVQDYGEETALMKDFLWHMDNVEMVRLAILSYFIGYKEEHSETINSLTKKKERKIG
jgi:transcriptional regulator with XRE-family HTH domain